MTVGFGNPQSRGASSLQYPACVNPDDPRPDVDPVVEVYKAGLDRSLIRENLRRSIEERLEALATLQEFADELRRAGRRARPR